MIVPFVAHEPVDGDTIPEKGERSPPEKVSAFMEAQVAAKHLPGWEWKCTTSLPIIFQDPKVIGNKQSSDLVNISKLYMSPASSLCMAAIAKAGKGQILNLLK
jgi:hypothetical protein